MNNTVVITIPSHPKYLSVVRAVTAKMGYLSGMCNAVTGELKLAVDEACSNVIKHAYHGDTSRKIIVKFRTNHEGLEVVIEDNGLKVDPGAVKGRDLDDIKPGGLGVHLIRRTFDVFEFDTLKKKGNRLRLVRYRKDEDGA